MIHVKIHIRLRKNLNKVSCEEPHKFLHFIKISIFSFQLAIKPTKPVLQVSHLQWNRRKPGNNTGCTDTLGQKSNVVNRSFRLVIIGKQSRRQLIPIFQILTSRKRQLERRVVQVARNKHAGKTREKHQPQNPKDIDVRQPEKLVSSVVHQQACCRSKDSHPRRTDLR